MRNLSILFATLLLSFTTFSQDSTATKGSGPSAEELAKANNPLADMKALNIQNYYTPRVFGNQQAMMNTTWIRAAIPTWKILWRASVPFSTVSMGGQTKSGLGDVDLFAAYIAVSKPKFTFGIGPSMSAPSAEFMELGSGKWTLGAAAVGFYNPNPKVQLGALAIWRTDVGGDMSRADVNFLAIQPIYFFQLGGGTYLRGAPTWFYNLETNDYNMPFGLGVGQVMKAGKTVFNIFIEPQYTALHRGVAPAFQLYTAINMQF